MTTKKTCPKCDGFGGYDGTDDLGNPLHHKVTCGKCGGSGEVEDKPWPEGSLTYRIGWPRPATPCDLVPLWKGEFKDFDDWVDNATTRLTGTTGTFGHEVKAICVDAKGRRCHIGADFMRARDEDAFPVRFFWECVPAGELD